MDEQALKEHAALMEQAANHGGAAVGALSYPTTPGADYYTSERKLQIFHTILQQRHELSPTMAAEAAEAVFQKLCVPQAPTLQPASTLPPGSNMQTFP